MTIDSKVEKALRERDSQRVLAMAGRIAIPIRLVKRLILDRDVGRIPHHHVVLLPENAIQLRQILRTVDMLADRLHAGDPRLTLEAEFAKPPPV